MDWWQFRTALSKANQLNAASGSATTTALITLHSARGED
jgi:hypothetical protein